MKISTMLPNIKSLGNIPFLGNVVLILMAIACSSEEDQVIGTEREITTYQLLASDNEGLLMDVEAMIDAENKTIKVVVPFGTDVSMLIPQIAGSIGARIQPPSNEKVDLSEPVVYTVTSELGVSDAFTVAAEIEKNTENGIFNFQFLAEDNEDLSTDITATIDEETQTIVAVFPAGTAVNRLTPTIAISPNATLSPNDSTLDFSDTVRYEITSESGVTTTYTVQVEVPSDPSATMQNDTAQITGFQALVVGSGSGGQTARIITGDIDQVAGTITIVVPMGLETLTPEITITENATVMPPTNTPIDLTQPISYTVTEDGRQQLYSVVVRNEPVRATPLPRFP